MVANTADIPLIEFAAIIVALSEAGDTDAEIAEWLQRLTHLPADPYAVTRVRETIEHGKVNALWTC